MKHIVGKEWNQMNRHKGDEMMHVNNIHKLMEIFIEARDTLSEMKERRDRLNKIIDRMDGIIEDVYHYSFKVDKGEDDDKI